MIFLPLIVGIAVLGITFWARNRGIASQELWRIIFGVILIYELTAYVGPEFINRSTNYDTEVSDANDSEHIPVLVVRPISFEPYFPSPPQVPGQFKAKIVAGVILKNKKIANNIRVKFDMDDGANRRVNSEEWNVIAKQKPLIFSMTDPYIKLISWTPDIPYAIKEIAQNRTKPFILRLLVTWEDRKRNQYRLKSYSELRYNEETNKYYFDERENKYLF